MVEIAVQAAVHEVLVVPIEPVVEETVAGETVGALRLVVLVVQDVRADAAVRQLGGFVDDRAGERAHPRRWRGRRTRCDRGGPGAARPDARADAELGTDGHRPRPAGDAELRRGPVAARDVEIGAPPSRRRAVTSKSVAGPSVCRPRSAPSGRAGPAPRRLPRSSSVPGRRRGSGRRRGAERLSGRDVGPPPRRRRCAARRRPRRRTRTGPTPRWPARSRARGAPDAPADLPAAGSAEERRTAGAAPAAGSQPAGTDGRPARAARTARAARARVTRSSAVRPRASRAAAGPIHRRERRDSVPTDRRPATVAPRGAGPMRRRGRSRALRFPMRP